MLRLRLLTGRSRFSALVVIASRPGRLAIWWIRGSVGSTRARTRLWSRRLLSASSAWTTRLTSSCSTILPGRDIFSKSTLLSREFFYFQNPGGVVSPSEPFPGEIIGLSRRTGCLAFFSSCCVAALQACETSRLGPPSLIADPGLFWAIFRMDFFSKQLFCVVRDQLLSGFSSGNGFGNR